MRHTLRKKLTITIDEEVYRRLYALVGRGHVSRFIEELVKPDVLYGGLEVAYQEMAEDRERETEALEWAEATIEGRRRSSAVRYGGCISIHR